MSKSNGDGITRREFVVGTAALGAAGVLGGFATPIFARQTSVSTKKKSRVVIGYSDKAINAERKVDQATIDKLVHDSVVKLTGTKNADDAWKSLFTKDDVVGLKVNCAAGTALSTKPHIVNAVVDGLKRAGVSLEKIIVWERSDQELVGAGFKLRKDGEGYRCYGVGPDVGFDDKATKSGDHEYKITKILSERITALVNLPILKDHGTSGVTVAFKNHYGSYLIDNSNIYPVHENNCSPYLAELNAVPAIKDKTRLVLTDAIYCCYDGGPIYVPGKAWYENAIMASIDPVAMDAVGTEMIDKARKKNGLPTLAESNRSPEKWLKAAADFKLGNHTADMIDRIVWTA